MDGRSNDAMITDGCEHLNIARPSHIVTYLH